MLTIRMQRTGRSGHAQFRVIVQDSRFSPTSGRVTAFLGSYDPHTKVATLDKEKATQYLSNGAQPSDRAAKLLQKEGVKLPDWVKLSNEKTKRTTRNPEKLRRNRPAEEVKAEAPAAPAEDAEASTEEAPVAEATETPAEETVAETETPEETPAAEPSEPEAEPEAAPETEEKAEEPAPESEPEA